MQTDSKFAIFFFLLICILMGKGLKKTGGISLYKLFMFSARPIRLLPVY